MRGQLGEKLIADLLRDIARRRLSGLLRLSQDKVIKAIFFESGAPVFAISNLPNEQIEHKLVKDRLVTSGLVEAARQRDPNLQRLGQTLVEMGALAGPVLDQAARDLAAQIIKSLFEYDYGEYIFDDNVSAEHKAKLYATAADCILEGARHAASIDRIAARIAPASKLVAPADAGEGSVSHSANLNSSEGYVLSCVQYPILVREVSAVTGLSETETRRAVCVLLSLGALMTVEGGREIKKEMPAVIKNQRPAEASEDSARKKDPAPALSVKPAEESDQGYARWVVEEVTRKLKKFENADHYEVLGVEKLATTTTIRQAYYDLEMMFNSFRARWPTHHELNSKLDALFIRVNHAYYTLTDLGKRRAYDMPSGQNETARQSPAASAARNVVQPVARSPVTQVKRPVATDLKKVAGEKYTQGRALYEKRDFHTAAHLLREAVKLDASRAEHHYHLAIVLSVLSQARHTHDGHEGCHVTCNLGGSLIRNQRVRYEALQHFQEAARLEPANALIRIKLGMLYKEAGMAKKAEACFWEALMLDGNNPVALQELGLDDKPLKFGQ